MVYRKLLLKSYERIDVCERKRIAWKEKHRYLTSLPFGISMDYYNLRLNEINVSIPTRGKKTEQATGQCKGSTQIIHTNVLHWL